jgi:hypothetical protein
VDEEEEEAVVVTWPNNGGTLVVGGGDMLAGLTLALAGSAPTRTCWLTSPRTC